jgi:hypothetical protein
LGGPISPGNLAQGPTKEGGKKTRYTDDDIAAIMGFSHVHQGDQVQPIWTTLNNAKQKNLDILCRQLLSRMMEWGYNRRIPIDTGVFLDVEVVKAIINLKFNPGEGVAHLSLAAKGLSILSCRGRTTGEIERLKERKEALTATKKLNSLTSSFTFRRTSGAPWLITSWNSKITLPCSRTSSGFCLDQTVITIKDYGTFMP